ncbi:MAG: glycosyltransferase [bacterium]|nr:glycosyltransferase [bacterium]
MISLRKNSIDTATPQLKIVVPTPLYGGSLPIAYHAADAFIELGHTCDVLRLDEQHSLFESLGTDVEDNAGKRLKSRFAELLADYVVERAIQTKADLVWYTAQSPVSIASLRRLHDAGIKATLWFVEDVRRFDYWKHIVREFDLVFSIQVGPAADAIRQAGARQVVYLPMAANVAIHRPMMLSHEHQQRYGSQVSFVGAGYPNRVALFTELELANLKLWGNDWPSAWTERLQESGRRVSTEETAVIYNASAINLNIHSAVSGNVLECGDFVNPRTFEIAACGGFQIVNRQSPLCDLFGESELCIVDDEAELKSALTHFTSNQRARNKMAEASRLRVMREHTYVHRMKTALNYVFHSTIQAPRMAAVATMADLKVAAHGDQDMQKFLAQFTDTEPATLQKLVDKVSKDQHTLSRAELIVMLMHEFRNWGVEKGVIQ